MILYLVTVPQPYLITQQTQVPLGLLYLSAVIKREAPHVDVRVLDGSILTVDQLVETVKDGDVIGVSSTSLDYPMALQLLNKLQNKTCIIGGPHATACEGGLILDGWDSVFAGEAEKSVLRFIEDYETMNIKVLYKDFGFIDMDWLPYPDRKALDWIGGRVMASEQEGESINMMSSRGCPHDCKFCASKVMWKRKLRWRKPSDVVAEIIAAMEIYNVKIVRFSDDNITVNPEWTREFCKLIEPLGVEWRLSVRVDTITPNLLETMHKAGLREVGLGCESFDPAVLKILNKKIEPEQSLQAIRWCHEAGIGARLLMMISTPGETYEHTVKLNAEALESVRGQFCYLSTKIFMPLPGTDIWDNPNDYKIKIVSNDLSRYNFYIYQRDENGEKTTSHWSPIEHDCMTRDQQMENIDKMFESCETFPENASGEL